MSGKALYTLEAVRHGYGGRTVLSIESLQIAAGELLCLTGPTGAGKSTLLRLLAGLERPGLTLAGPGSGGRFRFGEWRLDRRELSLEARRRIGLVFQRPLPLAGTVRANVEYGLRLRGRRREGARTQTVLDQLGLAALASRDARTLSGGETQLMALARALVLEPEVLLLDEPTAHLDPARVALVEDAVRAFRSRHAATVVWATHQLFQARRVADRVALLLDGRLIEAAGAERFFTAPADPRTAAFVRGEMIY
jgi:tungstate transport system ATP-binding protein